jgi:tetratricopeptide (TPR) repeat protein
MTEDKILVIGFFGEDELRSGRANFYGKYRDEIDKLNSVSEITESDTKNAIGYLLRKNDNDEKCFDLHLLEKHNGERNFTLSYIVNGNTDFNSAFIKSALRNIVPKEKLNGNFLPLCVCVEKEKLEKLIDDETALARIKKLTQKNDWLGIYNIFTPLEDIKTKDYLWSNDKLLSGLSFATAKLSETYINLKFSFKTDEERKKHLAIQKKYREETLMLRERCAEIRPDNPTYYSNLAYSHYQFVRELMMPGGRRDGSIIEEAKKSIEYIDKALALDPQRIPDLYRKGLLLSGVMPKLILYAGKNSPDEPAVKESIQKIKEGIECFRKIEEAWQILPLLEDRMTKRYQKEYIKSLYNTAKAYEDLAGDVWDITQYLLPMKYNESFTEGKIEKEKSEYLDKAVSYMEKCAALDNKDYMDKFPLPEAITLSRYNGVCEGSHKLYSFGKYYFQKYIILTDCDENQKPEAEMYRDKAEEFFTAALRFPSSPENSRQSKAYIAEKLSRVYISKGEYEKAIETLKRYMKDRTDYYIRYTYTTACLLSGKYEEAGRQTESAMKYEKSNLEMWLGYFLMYVKFMKENKPEEAEKNLKMASECCRKAGRKSPESLLIGQAYISYKKGDRKGAVEYLRRAREINPYRKGITKKINNWERNCGY